MRILHVTRERSGDRRFGIGRSLCPVIDALRAMGHEPQYLTHDELGERARALSDGWWRRGVPAIQRGLGDGAAALSMVWMERLNMGRLAARVADRCHADVVHLHDPWMAWGFAVARQFHRGARASRWGFTEHGFGSYSDATREEGIGIGPATLRRLRRLELSIARRAHWVTCPSESARRQLARDLALPEPLANWRVVTHPRPMLNLPTRAASRTSLGWSDDTVQILTIGRDNPVKRLDRVVRACAMIDRPVQLTLLGVDRLDRFRQTPTPASLRLEARVVDDVAPYLAAADLYVSASANESFGIANLEALAAGVPSICTASGAVPEVTGGAAWLIPGSDRELEARIAEAVRALIDDPALRERLARAGSTRAANWPDAHEVAQQLVGIYREAMA